MAGTQLSRRDPAGLKFMPKITEIHAKNILNKSKVFDYCLNPYSGCRIGCRYCHAALFMRRYSGHKEAWGDFVDIADRILSTK